MKVTQKGDAVVLEVKVVPNASRSQIAGVLGDALKIKVAQPPEDGKANRAVTELLAEVLGVAGGRVTIVAGHTRPRKTVQILGMTAAEVETMLGGTEGATRRK